MPVPGLGPVMLRPGRSGRLWRCCLCWLGPDQDERGIAVRWPARVPEQIVTQAVQQAGRMPPAPGAASSVSRPASG